MSTDILTPEQVAVAWLKTVTGVPADKVATTLPADSRAWGPTGFVQVTVVGGSPGDHVPMYRPVVQVDCWAANTDSNKVPWGRAGSLAQAVLWSTYRFQGRRVTATGFQAALLFSVRPLSEPRRVPDPDSGFARVQLDVELSWAAAAGPA